MTPDWLEGKRVWARKRRQPLPITQAPNTARSCGRSRPEQAFHTGCGPPSKLKLGSLYPSPKHSPKTNKKVKSKHETEVQLSTHTPSGCLITPQALGRPGKMTDLLTKLS